MGLPLIISAFGLDLRIVPDIALGTILHLVGMLAALGVFIWRVSAWITHLQAHTDAQVANIRMEIREGLAEIRVDMQRRIGNGPRPISERLAIVEDRLTRMVPPGTP